jgi:hypothetical protein
MIRYGQIHLPAAVFGATAQSEIVVEFGAGFFDKLAMVHSAVKLKLGIEIWKPYVVNAKYHDCVKMLGDVLQYRSYLPRRVCDTALMVDILEHFDRQTATLWLAQIMQDFDRIIAFIPKGNHPQTRDVTGFGAHQYQTHRSTWYESDILQLGFTDILIDDGFHNQPGKDHGAIWATWCKI